MSEWFRIVHGDVIARSSLFVDNYFDACLCDPPYLLQFMGKEFDKQHLKLKGKNEGQKMQAWHEKWTREVLRALKPGAHMLAFGGTRTYHRLASAAEDVGFEVRDMLTWMHGQGFPKGQNLKPAQEPIVLARKPAPRSTSLNIDGSRIAGEPIIYPRGCGGGKNEVNRMMGGNRKNDAAFRSQRWENTKGRWPANLILSHHETCNEECHPDCPVRMLDEQSGFSSDRPAQTSGGASRFFYCAKVSTRERNLGGIDCHHPTLKPIALTTYLARLLLPPAHVKPKPVPRRLLIPFSGAGSEIIGALLAGWDEVWGIEQDPEYIADAKARISARHTLKVTK